MNIEAASYFLKFDSLYGKFNFNKLEEDLIIENEFKKKNIKFFQTGSVLEAIKKCPETDIIVDCSGTNDVLKDIKTWIGSSGGKSIISRCLNDSDIEVVYGFNHHNIDKKNKLISASICDANGTVHVLSAINKEYDIVEGSATTIHPWLTYQNLMDGPVSSEESPGNNISNYSIGRAANASMIPKNTSAITACEKLIPEIRGKLMSMSFRSPTDVVSVATLSISLKEKVTKKSFIDFLKSFFSKSENIEIINEDVVSIDFKKSTKSCIIDLRWVEVNGNTIRLVLWYDNEWGYTNQLVNLCDFVAKL